MTSVAPTDCIMFQTLINSYPTVSQMSQKFTHSFPGYPANR